MFITAGPVTELFEWGEGDSEGHVLRETTSRGLCGLVCPSRTSKRGGEGDSTSVWSLPDCLSSAKLRSTDSVNPRTVPGQCSREYAPAPAIGIYSRHRDIDGISKVPIPVCLWDASPEDEKSQKLLKSREGSKERRPSASAPRLAHNRRLE